MLCEVGGVLTMVVLFREVAEEDWEKFLKRGGI
jgi:hypothetical protein